MKTTTLWVEIDDVEHAALLIAANEHRPGFRRLRQRMTTADGREMIAVGAVRE